MVLVNLLSLHVNITFLEVVMHMMVDLDDHGCAGLIGPHVEG